MKILKKGLFICFLVIFGLVLVACSSDSDTTEEETEGETTEETGTIETTTKEAKELIIGYTGPLSGPAALYGTETLNGLTLAVEEINAEIGRAHV